MMRHLVLAVIALQGTTAGPADAFCQLNPPEHQWSPGTTVVDVKLNEAIVDICVLGDCNTITDVETVTKAVLDEFFDDAGANIRFNYAGRTNVAPGTVIANTVHVYPISGCAAGVKGRTFNENSGGFISASRVEVCLGIDWRSLPTNSNNNKWSYTDTLGHELMHAIGFQHPNDPVDPDCLQNVASRVKTGGASFGHRLFKDDIDGLQSVYSTRVQSRRAKESTDGINWSDGGSGTNLPPALSRLSACNTSSPNFTYQSYSHLTSRQVQVTKYDGSAWTQVGSPASSVTHGHTGTACVSGTSLLVAWLGNYDTEFGLQTVFTSESTNSGVSWSTPTNHGETTKSPGIAATYDPATSRYIIAWRTDFESLKIKVLPDGDPVEIFWPGTNPLRSSDSFSIACGPTAITGTDNCLITWSHWDWDRFWYWGNGKVDLSSGKPVFVLRATSVYATPIVQFGTPNMAFWSTGSLPWEVTYHEGGANGVSWRKPASTTVGWQDRRTYTNSGNLRIVNPTLGSWSAGAQREVDAFYTATP